MNISKMASTVILATAFTTIFLFAFLFYLYGDLKDALSDAASFFGGIATLVAAYVATELFNDWRDQHNKNIESSLILKIVESFNNFDEKLSYFYGPISKSYDREQIEAFDPIFEKLKNNKYEILFDLQMSFLKVIDSIEKYSIVEGNYNQIHKELKHYKSKFRTFLKICEGLDYTNIRSARDTLYIHYGNLVVELNHFEQNYVKDLLIKLKEH